MKITKNTLKKLIKEELESIAEDVLLDWAAEAEREGAPAQAKKMAARNHPEYGRQLHDLHSAIRGAGVGGTVPELGQVLISLGNNYEKFAALINIIADHAEGLDPDVVKNFLIDTGQSYQPGGEYLV